MGQATSSSSITKKSFYIKTSDSIYEDISDRFTKATVSTLAMPVVIIAYPILNAYTFQDSDLTGYRIVDGAIGGLLGVIAWPLAPFFAAWGAVTFIFKKKPPNPLHLSPEMKARAEQEIQLDTTLYYNIAAVGISGSGKSSLINAILGYKDKDRKAAKVGEVETTSRPTAYVHPNLESMMIWDMPGVGTQRSPRETYFEKNFLCAFDLLVIVLGNRLMQDDIDIASKAKEHRIPVLFVRSKSDQAIASKEARYQGTREFTWAKAAGEFTLEVKDSVFSQLKQCGLSTRKLFIVSAYSLRQFVATINQKEKRKTIQLIDEERFMTSLIEGVLSKRRVTKKIVKEEEKKAKKC